MADYFVVNDGPVLKTRRKLDKILKEIDFWVKTAAPDFDEP
jgi:hypothetical protein